jgi:hypothetical protein
MPVNLRFQTICSESIRLKTGGQCCRITVALHPAGIMHHKTIVVLCIVLICPGANGLLCRTVVMTTSDSGN